MNSVVEWLALAASVVAVVISIVAYRSGLPRLKVSASAATIVGMPGHAFWPGVQVTVINNGGSSAQIKSVYLASTDSHLRAYPAEDVPNTPTPCGLEARGGVKIWNFDQRKLSAEAAAQVRDTPLVVRPVVEVGSKRHRSGRVIVNLPGDARWRAVRSIRMREFVNSWVRPVVDVHGVIYNEAPELDCTHVNYWAKTRGRRFTGPRKLTLMLERGDSDRIRADGYDQVVVPRMWPWSGEVNVPVPVVEDDAIVGDVQAWWIVTGKNGVGTGYGIGATSRASVASVRARILGETD